MTRPVLGVVILGAWGVLLAAWILWPYLPRPTLMGEQSETPPSLDDEIQTYLAQLRNAGL